MLQLNVKFLFRQAQYLSLLIILCSVHADVLSCVVNIVDCPSFLNFYWEVSTIYNAFVVRRESPCPCVFSFFFFLWVLNVYILYLHNTHINVCVLLLVHIFFQVYNPRCFAKIKIKLIEYVFLYAMRFWNRFWVKTWRLHFKYSNIVLQFKPNLRTHYESCISDDSGC